MLPSAASSAPGAPSARGSRAWRWGLALLLLIGTLSGLWWMQHKPERWYPGQDSHEYRILAQNLLAGHGYSRETKPPYAPALQREPGYPAFLATVFAFTNTNDNAVALIQSVLVGVSAVLAALLGHVVFRDRAIGLLGGLATALSPDLGDHARYEMSEALFTPLFLLSVLATFQAWHTRRSGPALLAGIAAALAGYVRLISLPATFLVVLASLVWDRFNPPSIGRRWGWAPILVGTMVLLAAPWVVRNGVALGQWTFTGRTGGLVVARGDKAAAPLEKQLQLAGTAAWAATFPFSQLVVPTERLYRPPNIWDGPLGELELVATTRAIDASCEGEPTIIARDSCQTRQGLEMILTHPVQYVLMTGVEFVRLSFYIYPSKLSVLRNWLVWLGLATVVACLLKRELRTRERTWLVLFLLAYVLPSIAVDAQPRYGVPLVPIYSLFAAAGVVWLARAAFDRRQSSQNASRQRSWRPPPTGAAGGRGKGWPISRHSG